MKKIITLTLILLLSGCYNAPDQVKPMSWLLKQMPKDAPNKYKRGWKDGCESGMSSMTNTMFKTFYSFKQDESLRSDPTYYKTWKDTYTFCRHYVYGTLRQANVRMNLPNNRTQGLTNFMGAEGILNSGMLQLWGPGDALKPLGNFGTLGGNLGDGIGMGNNLDFTDDSVMNGKRGGMNWNFGY